jgi:hypothetical protein
MPGEPPGARSGRGGADSTPARASDWIPGGRRATNDRFIYASPWRAASAVLIGAVVIWAIVAYLR